MSALAFWIVDKAHADEAERSRQSVIKAMPDVLTAILVDEYREHPQWFVDVSRILVRKFDWFNADDLLFLDSDTYMVDPVPELFEMLKRFDLVMAHAPGHWTAPTVTPVPAAFPEFNIGVIAMRNTQLVRNFWRTVYERQVKHLDVYGDNDQAALREALWLNEWPVRVGVIPNEYNARFNFGLQIRDRVKILHGRTNDYEAVAKSINQGYVEGYQLPPRLWSPHHVSG